MEQLDTLDFSDIKTSGFLGAFAFDELPRLTKKKWSVIVNTAPKSDEGEHWIAIVRKGDKTYFMDSYGRKLSFSETTFSFEFVSKLKNKLIGPIVNNPLMLQRLTSNACGYYAMYFVERLSVDNLKNTLKPFSSDLKKNDMYVYKYCKS